MAEYVQFGAGPFGSTTDAQSYASATAAVANSELLIGAWLISDCAQENPQPFVTLNLPYQNKVNLTFAKRVPAKSGVNSIYLYVGEAIQGSPTPTRFYTLNIAPTTATGALVAMMRFSGMKRSGMSAFRQFAQTVDGAAGTAPACTFANPCLTDNLVMSLLFNTTNPPALTQPAGWTEISDNGWATPTTGFEIAFRSQGFTGPTFTYGNNSATAYSILAFELDTREISADDVPPLIRGWGASR